MERRHFKFPHSPLKIFSFFVISVFFIIIATLFIAAAKGYKLEQKGAKFSFKKTGTLIITSQPSGAKIYINGKLYKKNTGSNLFATKINSLFAGIYTLRVEKEGYIPWVKEIEIKEEAVAWANYIKLFPKEFKEESVLEENIISAKQSLDNKKIAVLLENKEKKLEIHILDTVSLNKIKIYPQEKTETIFSTVNYFDWAFDSSKILINAKVKDKDNYLLLNAKDISEPTNITDLFKLGFEKLVFNPLESRELFGLKEGNLYKINIQDKTMSVSLMDSIISFDITQDRSIYGARKVGEDISLWKSDIYGNNSKKIIKSLPKSKNYKVLFSGNSNKILILVDGEVKTAYLADKQENSIELKQLNQEVTSALWSHNGKRIMLKNDKNIWVYDLEKEKVYETIKDQEIRFVSWDDGNDHFVVNIEGDYKVIEFDGKNQIFLGKSTIKEVFYSSENKNYFCVEIDEKKINKLKLYKRQ